MAVAREALTPEGKLASVVLMLLGIGLYSAIIATVAGAMLTGGAPAKPDAVARMDSLDALHAAGVTQPEYDAKRAKILDDL